MSGDPFDPTGEKLAKARMNAVAAISFGMLFVWIILQARHILGGGLDAFGTFILLFASAGTFAVILAGVRRMQTADQTTLRGHIDLRDALTELPALGWKIEYNVKMPNGLGVASAMLRSPAERFYVVDEDAAIYRGIAIAGDSLCEVSGPSLLGAKMLVDCLAAVRAKADFLTQRSGRPIQPIVCFSRARLMAPLPCTLRGIPVVDIDCVLPTIRALESG